MADLRVWLSEPKAMWWAWRIAIVTAMVFTFSSSCYSAVVDEEVSSEAAPGSLAAYRIGSISKDLRKYAKSEYFAADDLRQDGQFAQAEKKCIDLIKLESDKLGPTHPFILLPLRALSFVYLDQHSDLKLIEVLKRIDEMQRTLVGPESPDAADTFDQYLQALSRLGRSEEAMNLASRRLDTLMHCTVHGFYARSRVLLFLSQHLNESGDAHFYARWAAKDAVQLDYLDRDGMIVLLQEIGDTLVSLKERSSAMTVYGRLMEWRSSRSSTADRRIGQTLAKLFKLQLQAGDMKGAETAASWSSVIYRQRQTG